MQWYTYAHGINTNANKAGYDKKALLRFLQGCLTFHLRAGDEPGWVMSRAGNKGARVPTAAHWWSLPFCD